MRNSIIAILVLIAGVAQAAPNVTNVSGTVANGSPITITGTDFGANGPTVVLFDDFENGVNGNTISLTGPEIGAYSVNTNPPYVQYSTLNRVSGNLAARFDATNFTPAWTNPALFVPSSSFNSFYISWWDQLPAGDSFPGTGNSDGRNWKLMWVGENTWQDADVWFSSGDPGNWSIYGNNYPTPYAGVFYTVPAGRWIRWQIAVLGRTDFTGMDYEAKTDINGTAVLRQRNNIQTVYPDDWNKRNILSVNGFVRPTPGYSSHPTFDDVYFAVGDNSQSRVEIGNAATYTASTNMTMCTTGPGTQGWGDTSITCTVRAGGFLTNQTGYLYVTKADGTRNATGRPVTFGAVGGPYTVTASIGSVHGSPAGTIDGVTTPVSKVVSAGTTTTFTITPSAGSHIYSVSGCGGSLVGNTYTIAPASYNCSITAIFGQTITVSAGTGGSLVCTNPVINGEPSTCTAHFNDGFHTSGISSDVCGGTWVSGDSFTTGNVTQDCTVTATFAANEWLVTPSWGAHGTVSPTTSQTVANNGSVSFTITPDSGYYTSISLQGGCTGYGHGGNIYNFGPVTANCQFTASFLPLTTGGGGKGGGRGKNGKIKVSNGYLRIR